MSEPGIDTSARQAGKGKEVPKLLKFLLEFGPLLAFFIANWLGGIFVATGVIMVTTPIALAVTWLYTRKLAVMPIVTLVFVAVFGGLTLWLQNETFIKVKVTLVNILFGAGLLAGIMMKRNFLKLIFGEAMHLDAEGWRKLNTRWAMFFFGVAGLNEIVWRILSTDDWVTFKTFGILPLTFVFAMSQISLIQRHMIEDGTGHDT